MKTATVHAQQKWEYHCITRRTENYLKKDLNELGQQGWELTSVSFAKDPKGENAWIAFLKRPYAGHAAPPSDDVEGEVGSSPTPESHAADLAAGKFHVEGDEFQIKEE